MTHAVETLLVDGRGDVRAAIEAQESDIPFTVRGVYPRGRAEGARIIVSEYANRSTDCPVVDELSYRIDVWAPDRESVVALSGLVSRALTGLGLRRQYAGPDELSGDPEGYCVKSFRYGRRVDKRMMRLID